jgi:hypothetical protein
LRIFSEKATSRAVIGLPSWKVMPGAHQKPVGQPVRGYAHRARSKPVDGVRLVGGARHQAREGELHALRGVSPEDEAVERIEGEKVLIEGPGRPNM